MKKTKENETNIFFEPLDFLKNYTEEESFREVIFTFGNEEIVKENGKYYLENTRFPSINKEITMETATEMWQSYNMKSRSDFFVDFEK